MFARQPDQVTFENPGTRLVIRAGAPSAIGFALLLFLSSWVASQATAATQQIALQTGWNLISIQVGADATGFTIAQVEAGLDRANVLESVWAYDPRGRTYTSFQSEVGYPSDLARVLPGVGCWLKMKSDAVLTISGPVWSGTVSLVPGWNLVGFPGLSRSDSETLSLESIFRDHADRISQVWTFQAGSSLTGGQRFVGYDTTARPPLGELKTVEPGKGYWIDAGEAISLTPAPVVVLAPDTDLANASKKLGVKEVFVADPRWKGTNPADYQGRQVTYAGPEDAATDLNGNGILDDPYTQDTILFDEGVNTQNITILNSNSSLLNWSITTITPWLTFSSTNGATASESDYVGISVKRDGLINGSYVGHFNVDFGVTNRTVTVLLQVPTIAGDYRGAATTTRVNGNPISLGKVDLNLSMFMEGDSTATNRFRGVINRDFALLFPQDVFLDGVFYQGNSFSLTTTFEMPTGNRYEPPYETATNLYNYNPFPTNIYRQVTLQGTRTTADRVEGVYVESITGALPNSQPITIEGSFALDRQSLSPTKKSIYNGRSPTTPISIGGSGLGTFSYTNTLHVADAVSVQGVGVTVNTAYPKPEWLTLTLVGPSGQTYVLVNQSSNLVASAKFSVTNFNGAIGQGDWQLVVNWNGASERGQFNGWELNVQGLATYEATGTVVAGQGTALTPLSGATLTLVGGNIIFQSVTGADGAFRFAGLTENAYTLGISKLGYGDSSATFRLTRSDVDVGALVLQPLTSVAATLLATPTIGAAPLFVTFSPLVPLTTLEALGTNVAASWSFGDGSSVVLTNLSSVVEHTYLDGIHTNAKLVLSGSAGAPLTLFGPEIHAHALGPNTNVAPHQLGVTFPSPRTHFISAVALMGSVAAPVKNIGTDVQWVSNGVNTGYFYQESKRDIAAFDINRYPVVDGNSDEPPIDSGALLFDPDAEDTGFFVQAGTAYARVSTQDPLMDRLVVPSRGQPFIAYPNAGQTDKQTRFRLIATMGGFVFGSHPAISGNFTLQTGRIEP